MSVPERTLSPGEVVVAEPEVEERGYEQDLNVKVICPDCKITPVNLIEEYSSGHYTCADCGLVLVNYIIDPHSEYRTFANDESANADPSRVGKAADPLRPGEQLETAISFGDGNQHSRDLIRAHAKMSSNDKVQRELDEGYKEIANHCSRLALPDSVQTYAKHLFMSTRAEKGFQSKKTVLVAGCLVVACRKNNITRLFKDFHQLDKNNKNAVGRVFKLLKNFEQTYTPPVRPGDFVPAPQAAAPAQSKSHMSIGLQDLCGRFGPPLGMSKGAVRAAISVARQLHHIGVLDGRSPLSQAAACLYLASHLMGEPKSPKEIAKQAGVSDGTIRTAYKLMIPSKDQLIDPVLLSKGGDMSRLPSA